LDRSRLQLCHALCDRSFCHADTSLSLRKPEFWAAARFALQIKSTFVGIVAGADNVLLA
jgi:hypothetical protein